MLLTANGKQLDAIFEGLSETLKDQLVLSDLPKDLDSLIALAIRIDRFSEPHCQETGISNESQSLVESEIDHF